MYICTYYIQMSLGLLLGEASPLICDVRLSAPFIRQMRCTSFKVHQVNTTNN